MAVSTFGLSWKVIDYVPIIPKSGYIVLDVPLQNIVDDISNLCIGSSGNLNLAKDLAEAIGIKLKKLGVNAIVFGTLDTLSKDDTSDPLKRFSHSPYITAQVLELMVEGFTNAGIFPIVDGRGKIDSEVVRVLLSRKLFYPVMVEDENKMNTLKKLGYDTMFFTNNGPLYGKAITLWWKSQRKINIDELRKEILKRSIIILNPKGKGIAVNDPFSEKKILIFSPDKWLYEIAKKVERGEIPATGRPLW